MCKELLQAEAGGWGLSLILSSASLALTTTHTQKHGLCCDERERI